MPLFGAAVAAPNNGTTILYWFTSHSTVISPAENSRIQGLFKAFEWFFSTFQGRFNFQRLFKFKKALWIQVLFKQWIVIASSFYAISYLLHQDHLGTVSDQSWTQQCG